MSTQCGCLSAPTGLPPMMIHLGEIHIEGVRLGIYPNERVEPQPVVVDARLRADVTGVSCDDDIAQTCDYADIIAQIRRSCGQRHFELLESMVMAVTRGLLHTFPTLLSADVTIHKVCAPVPARVSARWRACRCTLGS